MIKINKWFPSTVITKYLDDIGSEVKKKNGGNEEIIFMKFGANEYKIKVEDLLTRPLKELKENCSAIELYIYLCSLSKYSNKNTKEFLMELSNCDENVVEIKANVFEVAVNGVITQFDFQKNNRFKPKDYEYIRKYAIERIKDYDINVYTNIELNYPDYYKSWDKFNALLKDIKLQLNTCLYIINSGTYKDIKYEEQPYIIHYKLIDGDLRHNLIASLDISTCPYCNRQYITNWIEEDKKENKRATADLDHFYQKKIYPLFALSLFNFVPSCQICNSRMKGSSLENTLYPYEEGFGDRVRFTLELKDKFGNEKIQLQKWLGALDGDEDNLELSLTTTDATNRDQYSLRVEGSKRVFKLNAVYQVHKNKAVGIKLKKRIFLEGAYEEYTDELISKLELKYPDLDLRKLIIGYDWDNDNYDEPLSKMTYDIFHSDEM